MFPTFRVIAKPATSRIDVDALARRGRTRSEKFPGSLEGLIEGSETGLITSIPWPSCFIEYARWPRREGSPLEPPLDQERNRSVGDDTRILLTVRSASEMTSLGDRFHPRRLRAFATDRVLSRRNLSPAPSSGCRVPRETRFKAQLC